MELELIVEEGGGSVEANSYVSWQDGDGYHAGHLYATVWTEALTAVKEQALVMATRLIDDLFQFNGTRATKGQALQWPRVNCPDRDTGGLVSANIVPKAIIEATCELARELMLANRTAAPPGEGQKYYNNAGVQTGYDKADTRPIIPKLVQAMLAKYGSLTKAKSGSVKLVRV
jgi:hypothetical protein